MTNASTDPRFLAVVSMALAVQGIGCLAVDGDEGLDPSGDESKADGFDDEELLGVFDDVPFTPSEAEAVLEIVNSATEEELDISDEDIEALIAEAMGQ